MKVPRLTYAYPKMQPTRFDVGKQVVTLGKKVLSTAIHGNEQQGQSNRTCQVKHIDGMHRQIILSLTLSTQSC